MNEPMTWKCPTCTGTGVDGGHRPGCATPDYPFSQLNQATVFDPVWPDEATEKSMLGDAWQLEQDFEPTSGGHDSACHIKALLSRVRDCEKEIERLRAGLGMISQCVSDRVPSMLAQATLDGANLLDEDTAIDVCEGHWRKP